MSTTRSLFSDWEARDIFRMLKGELAKKRPNAFWISAGIKALSTRKLKKNRRTLRQLESRVKELASNIA